MKAALYKPEEGSHQDPTMLVPRFQPLELWEIYFCYVSPPVYGILLCILSQLEQGAEPSLSRRMGEQEEALGIM